MKKIILLICATVLFISCSKSSDELVTPAPTPTPSGSVLLKKFITNQTGITGSITTDITYNGNKLIKSVSTDGTSKVFTYTGDLITKTENFEGSVLDTSEILIYNTDGKLIASTGFIYTNPTTATGTKITYTYNTNSTISFTVYTGNLSSQTLLQSTGIATLVNGEITKIEKYTGNSTTNPKVQNFTYDAKNNPLKNITGYGASSFIEETPSGFTQNVLTLIDVANSNNNETNTYTYNSNNYPLTQTKVSNIAGTINTQYFY